ncbi:DUF2158 domain-containing protein [bacterium]|nr:DUF2158 domain-containing protein [bacterium]
MSEELKVGDVVKLKSGGIKMTIEEIVVDDGDVSCVWFDGTQPQRGEFPAITLMKVDSPKVGIKAI